MYTTPSSSVFFSDDLLTEILSLLSVKSLLRFKYVSESWNALISDPNFVKFHLSRSKSQNQLFILVTGHTKSPYGSDNYSIIPYLIHRLLDNPSFTLVADPHYLLREKYCSRTAGSCNGLICLTGSLLMLNVMITGSVYGTQPLGKYLQKLVIFVIFVVSSSILVVIIPLALLKWLRHVTFVII